MISIEVGGLTEQEMDGLAASAPAGVSLEKMKLSLYSAGSHEVWIGFIQVAEKVATSVLAGVITKWLLSVRKKREPAGRENHSETIRIGRADVKLVDGDVSRVIAENIRIQIDRRDAEQRPHQKE